MKPLKRSSEAEISSIPIDRLHITPCNKCRKRESCLIKPKGDTCLGLEIGEPWRMPE